MLATLNWFEEGKVFVDCALVFIDKKISKNVAAIGKFTRFIIFIYYIDRGEYKSLNRSGFFIVTSGIRVIPWFFFYHD